jgi:hypothetical protein
MVIDVGPLEPALLLSLAAAGLIAWLCGSQVWRLTAPIANSWARRCVAGVSGTVLAGVVTVLPILSLEPLYFRLHGMSPGASVPADVIWPLLLLPAVFGVVGAIRSVRQARPPEGWKG